MPTEEAFKDHLLPGETLVWFGRPGQGLLLAPRDALLIPFSLLWGGFAIFWEAMVLSSKSPMPFALFGVPFVIIGLFLIVGRFVVDAWLRAETAYAVTQRRILILREGRWPSFKAIHLDRLPEATLSEGANGRGTIRFGAQIPMWSRNSGFSAWVASLDPTPQFLAIDNARRLFNLIQHRAQGA